MYIIEYTAFSILLETKPSGGNPERRDVRGTVEKTCKDKSEETYDGNERGKKKKGK
jgi:hypothetical protein